MAKELKYITDIIQGNIIDSWHVSQSVEAFSAATGVQQDYDISVSGSFKVTGSQFIKPNTLLNQTKNYILSYDNTTDFIGGGENNLITFLGASSVIAGGSRNTICTDYAAIVGGYCNFVPSAKGGSGFIGAGHNNTAYGQIFKMLTSSIEDQQMMSKKFIELGSSR